MRSTSKVVVDRSPVVKVEPVDLFDGSSSVAVYGLNLSVIAILGKNVFHRSGRRAGTVWPGEALVPGESGDGYETDQE